MTREIKGIHVLAMFVAGFAVIIAVNLTLAFNAVRTFPGLETKNSYVASQRFEADRSAQEALGWEVGARVTNGALWLSFQKAGAPVRPEIEAAVFGRATYAGVDQTPIFAWNGSAFVAPVEVTGGNYNLRLTARAADGTQFKQRIVVEMQP